MKLERNDRGGLEELTGKPERFVCTVVYTTEGGATGGLGLRSAQHRSPLVADKTKGVHETRVGAPSRLGIRGGTGRMTNSKRRQAVRLEVPKRHLLH
jgi:hypothetical protein